MKLTEQLTAMAIAALLSAYAIPVSLRMIANAKVSAGLLQLHQTARLFRGLMQWPITVLSDL